MKLKFPVFAVIFVIAFAAVFWVTLVTEAANALNMNDFIGDERAKAAALELTGGGQVTLCRLSYNRNAAEYEIWVLNGNAAYLFVINAYTGNVENFTRESTLQTALATQTKIGDERAKAVALEQTGDGWIILCRLNQNATGYEIGVLSGNAAYVFLINAHTGNVESFTRETVSDRLANSIRAPAHGLRWPMRSRINRQAFLNEITPSIIQAANAINVLPSVMTAQAILETGWGRNRTGNNFFGVKAGRNWSGKTVSAATREEKNGRLVPTTATFRAYDSLEESTRDLGRILNANRYAAVRGEKDYAAAARALHAAGYATDSQYARKLINIIEGNRLYELDVKITGL